MPLIHENLTSLFSDTANAIREKQGSSNALAADNFPSEIRNISVGPNTQDATATANDIISSKTAYVSGGKVTGTIPVLNESNLIVDGAKVTATSGYYPSSVNTSVQTGSVAASIATHTLTNPSVSVSHSGNIAIIGSTTKPAGTAGTDYYQIGFSNSVVGGNINAQAYGNISTNGYVTGANNTVSSWSNKSVSASVTQPATYYVNKGLLTDSDISGASYLENTGDYGFRATVVVPEGYHAGETVTKNFTTGIFPAPESKATADKMLTGYSLYDEDGKLVTGNMPNQGAQNSTISTQGGTYTIPAGYHDGNGVITASLGAASINTPSGSKTQSIPSFVWDETNKTLTASVAATSGTVYANIENSGYADVGTKSGTFTMGASSNVYTMDVAAINAPSGSATQSTPGFEFNTITGIVTASVAAKTGTVYANVTEAGYTGIGTKSGTFSLGASSNTYNVGLGTATTPVTTVYATEPGVSVTNSNGYVSVAASSGSKSITPSVTAGYISAGTGGIVTAVVNATGLQLNTKAGGTTTVTSSETTLINAGQFAVGDIKAKAAVGALGKTAASATVASDGLITNISNGAVDATDKIALTTGANGVYRVTATGSGGANVTTAGYLAAGIANSNSTTSAYYIAKGTTTAQANSVTVSGKTVTYNINTAVTAGYQPAGTYWVNGTKAIADGSATTPATTVYTGKVGMSFNASNGVVTASSVSGTASVTPTVVAGYVSTGTAGTITATSNENSYTVGIASINAPSGSKAQSTPTFSWDATNRKLTASVAATSGTAYANVTGAGYTATGTKSGTFTMSASSNTYTMDAATINAPSGSAGQSKPTFSIDTTNGIVTASVAATSGTAYANVTGAGYTGTATKSGTFTMTASSNTYTLTAATANTQTGAATVSASSALANAITPTNVLLTDTVTDYKIVSSANATSGAITAKTVTATAGPGFVKSGTVSASATVSAVAAKTASDSKTKYLNKQTISSTSVTPYTNGTAQTVTVSEGYRNAAATITVSGVAAATRSAGTAAVLNNSNGNIRYYVNTTAGYTAANTTAYYLQLNTKAGGTTSVTTTATTLINAGQFAIGDIKAQASSGTLAAGTAAVLNNSNGNIRYYRNVSAAGYIAANTTAYYLQLNTKGGSTTYVNGTGATLVNAGQFVTGAIIAKAANVTYNSTSQTLTIPAGLVTVS